MTTGTSLQIISKISKYCNLRCTYCYEFPDLGNRARMSLDTIGRMFANLRRHVDENGGIEDVVFYWHGGEPLLIKPDYYLAIGELSKQVFAGSVPVVHTVQTNLTVLSDPWIAFLRERRFFTHVSVSFDVIGAERVDARGRQSNARVMDNMQKLIDNAIDFGAIAVLARHNLDHVRGIYRFYDALGVPMRLLPFYLSASADQVQTHGLSGEQIVDALCVLFDEWMSSETATPVEPLATTLDYALAFVRDAAAKPSDRELQENLFVVTPSGETWGLADMYVPGAAYGNIVSDDLATMFAGPSCRRAKREAQGRLEATCAMCPYFGACPGDRVAYASPDERVLIDRGGCLIRPVLDHIVRRLEQTGLSRAIDGASPRHGRDTAIPVAV